MCVTCLCCAQGVYYVTALDDLAAGTELCYAYVDPAVPLPQRHMELNRTFMFECSCKVKGIGER